MNKRLVSDYQAWPSEWQKFCTVVGIKDFKQQDRIRMGAFGSLSTVPEDTAYTTLTISDTRARDELELTVRDALWLMDLPLTRLITWSNQSVGSLITALCGLVSMPLAPLPTTQQFSQTVPCFVANPGTTPLQSLHRLSGLYGFWYDCDATGRLRISEPAAGDPGTWNYGAEALAIEVAGSAGSPNVVRAVGTTTAGATVFGEAVDSQGIMTAGRERTLLINDRLLDTAAKCVLRA